MGIETTPKNKFEIFRCAIRYGSRGNPFCSDCLTKDKCTDICVLVNRLGLDSEQTKSLILLIYHLFGYQYLDSDLSTKLSKIND